MLAALVNDSCTDKNTSHSYLPLYDELLHPRKERARAVLEIGVQRGGSIALWHQYFTNATVHGIDIMETAPELLKSQQERPRVVLHLSTDAYSADTVAKIGAISGQLDMLLDDGPHSLKSMQDVIRLYLPIIADDGILIIEDVQDYAWFEELRSTVPEDLRLAVRTYDLRGVKNRYDDLVFVVDKSLLKC